MAEGIPDYDELKVRIEPGPGGSYRVLAFAPDGSTGSGSFAVPFETTELDNFILRVGLPRRSARAYRSSRMEEAKEFGSTLCEALLRGGVRTVYEDARAAAEERDRGLRVTLCLTDVPELMEIPWEFLYDRPSFLAQSIYTPVVRSLDLERVRAPRKLSLPLRILGMVSRPEGLEALDVDSERGKLEEALRALIASGMVELSWLPRATLSELERVIGAPDEIHVLHYIGHGAYDERTSTGILVLEDSRGGPHEVTGEELGMALQDERSLRLVVLNACEGARTSHVDPFSGVASSLVECNIPAVVGMQFEITDRAAITLAERLYGAVAQGFSVDAALAQARKAVFAGGNDIEFGTPVLFLRAADARLFEVESGQRPVSALPPASVGDFSVRVEAVPGDGDASERAGWELVVDNTGSSRLTGVTARQADGQALAPPADVEPGARHTVRWSEPRGRGLEQLITVTATDATGAQVSDQVTVGPPTKPAESKRKRWLAFGAAAAAVIAFGLAAIFLLGGSPEPSAGAVVGKPIAIGNKSYWLTTGEGAAWVTNGGGEAITRVDPVTGRTTSIDIGKYSSPTVLAAGQGAVWVFADPYDHYLSRVDPKTNKVTNIRVPEYTPRAQLALGQGAVWILDIDHRRVVGVDAETNRVTRPIPVDPKPTAITVGGGWIYVAHRSGKYETIDPDLKQTFGSGRLTSDRLSGMEYADGKLYGFQGTHQVAVADPDSGACGRPIELGRGVNAFVVGLGAIWALDAFDGKLVRIDPATRQPVGEPIPVGDGPLTLTVGEGFVWVTLTDGKLVRVRPS